MQYYVTCIDDVIDELFSEESAGLPEDVIAISEEQAAILKRCSSFDKYKLVDSTLVENVPELVLADFKAAHDAHINAPAIARGYDSFATFALRAMRPGPWQEEGIIFFDWMEECNVTGYQILNEVNEGIRPIPASIEEYIALLPVLNLPPPTIV